MMRTQKKRTPKLGALDSEALEFFKRYLEQRSPSGEEADGQEVWIERIAPYVDEIRKDVYGSVIAVVDPDAEKRVVLAAHADEIGWMVNYVTPEGYLRVDGTADPATALGRAITLRTRSGDVDAVVGWPATHMRDDKKEPEINELFLDCGCTSKEEVEKLGIHVGCTAVYSSSLQIMNKRMLVGRALDNRIGGLMLTEVARYLHEHKVKLPFGLYFVNAVQEEVGTKGAGMVVESIKPDIALVTDVCHDTTMPGVDKSKHGDIRCGGGPVLSYGAAVHDQLIALLEDSAAEEDIPYQRAANFKSTGTDADAFAYGSGGTRTALISIPIKYMHTPVESCYMSCVVDGCRLMIAALQRIAITEWLPGNGPKTAITKSSKGKRSVRP